MQPPKAIDDFQNAERLFYKRRAEELSDYPGIGDKTKAQVEKDYDDLLVMILGLLRRIQQGQQRRK